MELQISNIEGNSFATASNVYDVYQENNDKDIFESVLDNLMLEKYSDDKDLNDYIKSLPKENKRIATLSVLSDDNDLWKKISALLKKDISSYERLKDIYFCLRDYIKIAEVDRKGKGEIHTPFLELAQPMMKLVEKYDSEFWKNKNHKVLDSSAGYGTFLILAAYKFMIGLKDEFPDEEERFKWVVENCLYYGEIQAKSVFSWLMAIDPFNKYKTNIYFGDFLSKEFDKHVKEIWEIKDGWDLVAQNPPYQILKETNKNKNSKNPKTQPLWHLFVQKSLSILNKGGYMVMVHPGGWRDLDGLFKETQNMLKSKQILELHMFPFKSGLDIFKAKTNFDYYILKNEKNNNLVTEIHCENESIERLNLLDLYYIPGENISLINSLFAKNKSDRVVIISDSSYHTQQGEKKGFLSKLKTTEFNLPVVYMVSYKNNPSFWYSNINKGHFGERKVIWANGSSGVIIDKFGEYGLTQFSRAIIDSDENLENIKKALESDKFIKEVMLFKNGLGHKYNNKVISMLKKDFWKKFI